MLARQAAAAVGVGTYGREKLLLRCRLLDGARRFGAHGGRRGRGHIVAAARLQLVFYVVILSTSVYCLFVCPDRI